MKHFLVRDDGISAIEYVLIALLIALAIIIGASQLGTSLNKQFDNAATDLSNTE